MSYSAQEKLENPSNDTKTIYKKVIEIFNNSFKGVAVRLIGVRLADLVDNKNEQISIFEIGKSIENNENIQETIDMINNKFGVDLVTTASLKAVSKNKKD